MRRRILIGSTLACIVIGVGAFCVWAIQPVLHDVPILPSTKILDQKGGLLYEISRPNEGNRTLASLESIPKSLKDAVIAAEDRHFYSHRGVDFFANLRAVALFLRDGKRHGGASTIEQQLIKTLYFPSHSRSALQKLREMVGAMYWASTHTKQETLEMYLNTIYFGNHSYGIAAAATNYFQKNLSGLTLSESTLLAGIIPAPSEYDPLTNGKNAKARQSYVLGQMVEEQMISIEQQQEALDEHPPLFRAQHDIAAPHFVFHVLEELEQTFPDIASGGYAIYTTLDPDLQWRATDVMSRKLVTLGRQHVTNSAVLAIDPHTGDVLAYVGSNGYKDLSIDGQVDMVTAQRQPGSALKPFLYAASFLHGFTPASVIPDLPVRFETADGKSYTPRNYGYQYSGPVSIRDALGSSLNIPAVKVADAIGLPTFFGFLSDFGIHFPEPPEYYGLGVVLGGGETTLWDVTRAYAELARQGKNVTPRMISHVENALGQNVFQAPALNTNRYVHQSDHLEQAIELVTDILSDPTARSRSFGESSVLETGKRVAVKTGTTRDFRDNWAFGYTPEFVLGVWVGNADNSPMEGVTGVTGAAPIWRDIMTWQLRDIKNVDWPTDETLITRNICTTSGLLANDVCPKKRLEKFIPGTEPTRPDDWYIKICHHIYLLPPSEYSAWQASAQHEKPPTHDCDGKPIRASEDHLTILSPLEGDIFQQDELIREDSMHIPFVAGGSAPNGYRWVLNGEKIPSGSSTYLWKPRSGDFTLSLEGADRQIHFIVE